VIPPRCLIVQGHLGRFVDGALPDPRARTVRDHIAVCPRCLEAERMARAIPVMLSSPLDPPPPPTLLPRLLTAPRRRRRRERRATAMAAALVLLLACAALVVARSRPEPDRSAAGRVNAGASALIVADEPAAPLAAGKPATLGAAPAVTRTLSPPLKVDQFTMPNLATPCPATERSRAAANQTLGCQTRVTPKPPNKP
jgi:hypothetical protein